MSEIPHRFPPPLSRSQKGRDGLLAPIMETPFLECGQEARLGGVLVVCIRRKGHPVRINYGHSNGYTEWAFDTHERDDDTP